MPERFEFSFNETLVATGVEIDENGDGFACPTEEMAVLVVNAPASQKAYTLEDFPDPEADDFPGMLMTVEPTEAAEDEEEIDAAAAAVVTGGSNKETKGEKAATEADENDE